jgi:dCTP deaminase
LGDEVAIYQRWVYVPDMHAAVAKEGYLYPNDATIDVKCEEDMRVHVFRIGEEGTVLRPNILYLMHTLETVHTLDYVPVIDGKNSLGRLGLMVHATAGFGDPGFAGQFTLEVSVLHPLRVYAGMKFCQLRFHMMAGPPMNYQKTGHYIGKYSVGPVASRVYTQFNK